MTTIYSIRTSMGGELWWTTNRKRALAIAADLTEPGQWITPSGNVGGFNPEKGLRSYDFPVLVHKCSVIKAGA